MSVLSPLLAMQLLENNQSGRYLLVNAALYTLEGLIRVLSRSAGAVPATPAEGDGYIVDTVADGWATATLGDIALYYGSAWHFVTPVEGMEIPIADEQSRAMWTGSIWHVASYGLALAADPPDPPNNMRCVWQSDGTGSGDDGDILMKITDSTGTTKTATLIDFSAV
jgi:hypothetical protein